MDDNWPLDSVAIDELAVSIREAAHHIYDHLGRPRLRLVVRYAEDGGPIAVFDGKGESKQPGAYREIHITSVHRPTVIYQFAHEFCHVIQNYNRFNTAHAARREAYKTEWFREVLCELSSIYVMYAFEEPALRQYVDGYRGNSIEMLNSIEHFRPWLRETEAFLREIAPNLDRGINAVVAYRLVDLFDEHPELWRTLWNIPVSGDELTLYLAEWRRKVDRADRPLIDLIRQRL